LACRRRGLLGGAGLVEGRELPHWRPCGGTLRGACDAVKPLGQRSEGTEVPR
jgi:hypothetical protein